MYEDSEPPLQSLSLKEVCLAVGLWCAAMAHFSLTRLFRKTGKAQ